MPSLKLDFAKMNGLLPVVIQDYDNGEVLMVGFMNEEAWKLTNKTRKVHYWSRKKKRLWMKGEESGHIQYVKEISVDNDYDTLLIKVNQIGGAVEDGYRSCFHFLKNGNNWINVGKKVFDPKKVYKNYSDTIVIAIPSGSLYSSTIMMLGLAGYQLELRGSRSFKPLLRGEKDIKLVVARAQEIPRMLQDGIADIGLTGVDLIEETGVNVTKLADLKYNENGIGKIAWVLAVPKKKKTAYRSLADFEGKKIYTEVPNTVRKYFSTRDISVVIDRSVGTTESKAPFLCDAIVDICETGKSLIMNDLIPLYCVSTSTVHLFACNESIGYGWKRRKIAAIEKKLIAGAKKLPKNPKRLLKLPRYSS